MGELEKEKFSIIKNGTKYLIEKGVSETFGEELMFVITIISLVIICFLADYITKKILINVIKPLVSKTKTQWDDLLFEQNVFKGVAHLVPVIILSFLIPIVFDGYDKWVLYGFRFSKVYLSFAVISILVALFNSLEVFMENHKLFKDKPVESYTQLLRLLTYLIGGIYIISIIIDQSPLGIFSALGAMSVVLMLVFKDTILGFVASIQMAANNMVKINDWVEFPKYGADGTVEEIKLQTVKIRNWDKTITNVPTYAFISDAFKNWRGMEESGGRRIKRSIIIDMRTIKFCDEELINRLKKIKRLQPYLNKKLAEIEAHNNNEDGDKSSFANLRKLTNIGTFRAYVQAYLDANEIISKDLTFLVRQLQPTDKGLPIEIYVFSKEQRWAYYEAIQADIFDHLFAIVSEFELGVYQSPSGLDFSNLLNNTIKS